MAIFFTLVYSLVQSVYVLATKLCIHNFPYQSGFAFLENTKPNVYYHYERNKSIKFLKKCHHIFMMTKNVDQIFAKKLAELMDEKKTNQMQLSLKTHIPQPSISAWLNLTRSIHIDALVKLADFFCVSTDYLLGRED